MGAINRITAAAAATALLFAGCGEDGGGAPSVAPSSEPPAVEQIETGGSPVATAVGEGFVWVADQGRGRVLRIDPATAELAGPPARVGSGPVAIAAGEGSVWAAAADGTVTRIDPADGRPVGRAVEVTDPTGIALGEGAVWVASGSEGTVARLDPESGEQVGEAIPVGERPVDLAVGEGAVWVANSAEGTVTRIDADSGEPGAPIAVADEQLLALAYGEGGVWVAASDEPLAESVEVSRIDPATSELAGGSVALEAGSPVRLAAGEGYVWATLVGGAEPLGGSEPAAVQRIDPQALEPIGRPVEAGDRPTGIAVGEGSAWVASAGDGTIVRLQPRS